MEASAPTKGAFGMRLFDAGEFHVGFGIVVPSDEETTGFSIQGMTRNGRVPFRHSLAVTLFGDSLCGSTPLSPELEDAFTSSLAGLKNGVLSAHQRQSLLSSEGWRLPYFHRSPDATHVQFCSTRLVWRPA